MEETNFTALNQKRRLLRRVCVYCASSTLPAQEFRVIAAETGRILAQHEVCVVYGGGSVGSMGALADGALEAGGRVIGVLPQFMHKLEWGHPGLSELHIVNDLHERKRMMIEEVDGIVALPGGCGTYEELMEALTWKRLGLYLGPIVLVNTRGYFNVFQDMMKQAISEKFMAQKHMDMWDLIEYPVQLINTLYTAPDWDPAIRSHSG